MHEVPNCNQPYNPKRNGGLGGYYQASWKSGLMTGIAANAPVFSFRWAPAVRADGRILSCQLKFLKVFALTITAFGAAQVVEFDTFTQRLWTASDTGGTAGIPASGDQKRMNDFPDSAFVGGGDIRISNTAALGVGTRPGEAIASSSFAFWSSGIGVGLVPAIIETWDEHHVPMVFEPNQGFVIQNSVLMGASGVVQLWVDIGWMEEDQARRGW